MPTEAVARSAGYQTGLTALFLGPNLEYTVLMNKNTSNVYATQVLAQGRDLSGKAAAPAEFAKTIHGRTFESQAEYDEAFHEFLNGF